MFQVVTRRRHCEGDVVHEPFFARTDGRNMLEDAQYALLLVGQSPSTRICSRWVGRLSNQQGRYSARVKIGVMLSTSPLPREAC
jgi:hypothetical protein